MENVATRLINRDGQGGEEVSASEERDRFLRILRV
jgi:hypothetical protein